MSLALLSICSCDKAFVFDGKDNILILDHETRMIYFLEFLDEEFFLCQVISF